MQCLAPGPSARGGRWRSATESQRAGGRDSHRWEARGPQLLARGRRRAARQDSNRGPRDPAYGREHRGSRSLRLQRKVLPTREPLMQWEALPASLGLLRARLSRAGGRLAACAAARTSPHRHTRTGGGRAPAPRGPVPRLPSSRPYQPLPGCLHPRSPCPIPSPVLALRFSRKKWPLERCWRPKFWAILSHTVPLPEPGGPRMTARRSLEAMALEGIGWPGPQPARFARQSLPRHPLHAGIRLPPLHRERRGFLRRPRPSAPPSATSSPGATPVQHCGVSALRAQLSRVRGQLDPPGSFLAPQPRRAIPGVPCRFPHVG